MNWLRLREIIPRERHGLLGLDRLWQLIGDWLLEIGNHVVRPLDVVVLRYIITLDYRLTRPLLKISVN